MNGWKDSIRGIPDADDRHIVAAAAQGQASVIVHIFNIRDFPSEALPGALFSQSPDDFFFPTSLTFHHKSSTAHFKNRSSHRETWPYVVCQ